MSNQDFSDIISTIITNGFHIHKIERLSPTVFILNVYKFDRLGAEVRYSMLFSEDLKETPILHSLSQSSKIYNSKGLYINDNFSCDLFSSYTKSIFFNFFGGLINTGLILIPNLAVIMKELGHNKLPTGLLGKPDDLHEIYVCESLQFLLSSPTRRYGIDRLFQKLPDGVVLGKDFMLLLDSKSYSDGFSISSDDLDRFASYVNDFNLRYSAIFGKVYKFVVATGTFINSSHSIQKRSNQLYSKCNCGISCITSEQLGKAVELLLQNPDYRHSIDWKIPFSEPIFNDILLKKEMDRINKDKIY